eukprot:sb/3473433/
MFLSKISHRTICTKLIIGVITQQCDPLNLVGDISTWCDSHTHMCGDRTRWLCRQCTRRGQGCSGLGTSRPSCSRARRAIPSLRGQGSGYYSREKGDHNILFGSHYLCVPAPLTFLRGPGQITVMAPKTIRRLTLTQGPSGKLNNVKANLAT